MRREEINPDVSALAFNFFYWFSRFEYALKESEFLKSHVAGEKAEPGWNEFIAKWEGNYAPSEQASNLLKANPETQVVAEGGQLTWKSVGLAD